jgi:N-acetylglucosaminyldiphosphoundecaprenol N-acetyl-beta-D-mannosaminyltransferase
MALRALKSLIPDRYRGCQGQAGGGGGARRWKRAKANILETAGKSKDVNPAKIRILGIRVDRVNQSQALAKIDQMVKSNLCHQIVTVNPEFILTAQKDKEFARIINQASLALPDGTGILWAAKRQGTELEKRVTGADLVIQLARKRRYSLFLLGGKPGVAKKASNTLMKRYQGLKILGATDGGKITPKNISHQRKLVEHINALKPDILLVGLGAPKQDKFIHRWQRQLKCKVGIGVGGTFDYIIGQPKRAPRWMQKLHLEWLWRLIREPKRSKRILKAVIIFPLLVLFSGKR